MSGGKLEYSDFIGGNEDLDVYTKNLKLERGKCLKDIIIVLECILTELNKRNEKIVCKSKSLSARELAEIAYEFRLVEFMDKTTIVKLFHKIREESSEIKIKNTALYKKL